MMEIIFVIGDAVATSYRAVTTRVVQNALNVLIVDYFSHPTSLFFILIDCHRTTSMYSRMQQISIAGDGI